MNAGRLGPRAAEVRLSASAPRARAGALVAAAIPAAFGASVAAAIAAASPNGAAFARALADGKRVLAGDLGTHLGREVFGGVGSPAGAFGWLAALIDVVANDAFGSFGSYALALLAAGGAAALIAAAARARASTASAALAAALAVAASFGALRIGGDGLGWCAAAAFLFFAARAVDAGETPRARRDALAAIVAAVAWCNLSWTGIAAPLVALLAAVGATLAAGAADPRARSAWLIAGGAVLATLATPALLAYPTLAFATLGLDRGAITPLSLHPIQVDPLGYRYGFIAFAIALALFGIPRERRGFEGWAIAGAFVLALDNGALLPLFVFVAAPALATALNEVLPAARADRAPAAAAWLAGALTALAAYPVLHEAQTLRAAAGVPSAELFAGTLERDGRVHRIVCERVERCADVVALGDPNLRVLMDDRASAFPDNVRTLQTDFSALTEPWLAPLVRAKADALVVERDAHIDSVLALDPTWTRVASDERIAIYERAARATNTP